MDVWIIEITSGPVRGIHSVWWTEEEAKASIPGTWTSGYGDAGQESFITIDTTPYRLLRMSVGGSKEEEPRLGLATTRQLLEEITVRIEIDGYGGGRGLDYRTVDHA
jgi:hypothetical protein